MLLHSLMLIDCYHLRKLTLLITLIGINDVQIKVAEQCHVNNESFASRKECIKKKTLKLSDMIIDIKIGNF